MKGFGLNFILGVYESVGTGRRGGVHTAIRSMNCWSSSVTPLI